MVVVHGDSGVSSHGIVTSFIVDKDAGVSVLLPAYTEMFMYVCSLIPNRYEIYPTDVSSVRAGKDSRFCVINLT